jgi:sulfur dioxygenase
MSSSLFFRQFFEGESFTYTYLLACNDTKEAILIDPVVETAQRDADYIKEMGLHLKYAINTHCHADHVTGTAALKGFFPDMVTAIAKSSGARADLLFEDGDKLEFGSRSILCMSTPGHTDGCFSFVLDDSSMVFTGDALLIRGCGRTDFQAGNAETLFDSVRTKIFSLPDACAVFPAHDYKGRTQSSIGEEKQFNLRLNLGKSKSDFVAIMDNLNLAYPKQIDRALPLNMRCGYDE